MTWDEALGTFDERVAAHHHVDLYWFPHTDRMLVKSNDRLDGRPVRGASALAGAGLARRRLPLQPGLRCRDGRPQPRPRAIPRANRVNARLLGARTYSDVAHRVFTSQRRVVFREMEYAVPRAAGLSALREVRAALEASDLRVSFPVEVRVAPADDVALSTAAAATPSTWPSTPTATPSTRRTSR